MEKFYMRNKQKAPPKYQDCLEKLYKEGKITYDPANFNTSEDSPPEYPPPPPPPPEESGRSVLTSDQYYPSENQSGQIITDKQRYPVGSIQDYYEPKYAQIRAVRSPGNVQQNKSRNSYYDDQYNPMENVEYHHKEDIPHGSYDNGHQLPTSHKSDLSYRKEGRYSDDQALYVGKNVSDISHSSSRNNQQRKIRKNSSDRPSDRSEERLSDQAHDVNRNSSETWHSSQKTSQPQHIQKVSPDQHSGHSDEKYNKNQPRKDSNDFQYYSHRNGQQHRIRKNSPGQQSESPRSQTSDTISTERRNDLSQRRIRRLSRESLEEHVDASRKHDHNVSRSIHPGQTLNRGSSVESIISSNSSTQHWVERSNLHIQDQSLNNSSSYPYHGSRRSSHNSPRYQQTSPREHSNNRRSSEQLHLAVNNRNSGSQYSDSRRSSTEEPHPPKYQPQSPSTYQPPKQSIEHSNHRRSSGEEYELQYRRTNRPHEIRPPSDDQRYYTRRSLEKVYKTESPQDAKPGHYQTEAPRQPPPYHSHGPQYQQTSICKNENPSHDQHSIKGIINIPEQANVPSHLKDVKPLVSSAYNNQRVDEKDLNVKSSHGKNDHRAGKEIDKFNKSKVQVETVKNPEITQLEKSNQDFDNNNQVTAENLAGKYIEKFTCRYERVGGDSYRKSDLEKTDEFKARNSQLSGDCNVDGSIKYQRSLSMDAQNSDVSQFPLRRSSTNPFLDPHLEDIDMSSIPYAPHKFLPKGKENIPGPDVDEDVGPPPPPRKFAVETKPNAEEDREPITLANTLPSTGKFEHKVKRKLKAKKLSKDDGTNRTLEHRKSLPEIHSNGYVHPKSMTLPRRKIQTDTNSDTDEDPQPLNSNPFFHGSLPLLDQVEKSDELITDKGDGQEDPEHSAIDIGFEPGVVLRQLKLLLESEKFPEAEAFVNRLSQHHFSEILPSLALGDILERFPGCLALLCIIFDKIGLITYPSDFEEFPIKNLDMDLLMKVIVKYFATEPVYLPINFDENLRNVLKVVAHFNPKLRSAIYKRKHTLEQCLTGLAKHGFVAQPDGKLVQLHEAFKIELSKNLQLCKTTLPKLEEFIPKTPVKSQKSSKYVLNANTLPPEASHQRMLIFSHREVEDRLIRNRALCSTLEGFGSIGHLQKLTLELEERIRCDKFILLHYNELKKQMKIPSKSASMAPHLQLYAKAFTKVLEYFPSGGGGDCDDEVFDSDVDLETWDAASCSSSLSALKHGKTSTASSAPSLRSNHKSISGYSAIDISRQIDTNGLGLNCGNSGSMLNMAEQTDIETLRNQVLLLKKELLKERDRNENLETREKLLKERLSEKAQHNVQCGSTFEDLNLGDSRPTQLIRRYSNLYSQARVDALDALDSNAEISEFDDLKVKLLFSVVVLAFRAAQDNLDDLKSSIQQLLYLPVTEDDEVPENHSDAALEMEQNVLVYLRKTTEQFDHSKIIDSVGKQLWATLFDYPSLRQLEPLLMYIEECASVAWALIIQNPPFVLDYESTIYNDNHHTRFFLSDAESSYIKTFLWPTLLEHENGPCLFKGVVVT